MVAGNRVESFNLDRSDTLSGKIKRNSKFLFLLLFSKLP
jgi:hypothetical protein